MTLAEFKRRFGWPGGLVDGEGGARGIPVTRINGTGLAFAFTGGSRQ